MLTSEQKIVNNHLTRMEFRKKLEELSSEYMNKLDMWDMASEYGKLFGQLSGFISGLAFAHATKKEDSHEP